MYPNMMIIDSIDITVRIFWPITPELMEVTAWQLAPKGEKAELLARRLDNFLTFPWSRRVRHTGRCRGYRIVSGRL